MGKLNQHSVDVRISGIPHQWNQKSGGNLERGSEISWNGGSPNYDLLAGVATFTDLTLTRDKRHEDEAWLRQFRDKSNIVRRTITVQELDETGAKVGRPVTYPNCLLTGVQEMESQAGSNSPGQIALTFANTGPAR
ncbi:hypothetical protein [Nesterenkonia flava]|uniref:Phage tail protein n=1 Tax=Nesterenkonia flava TaxID=469799 RepID=A0ABU1FRW0_9MICC|nr:hypothetical protein [Nesterenkonia flava]MDR5711402.1 hypothetical protein [Nesterenkonia flava]